MNFEALADDIRQIVQDLRQVAAGLALQHNRGDEELYVDQGHALGEIDEGVADGHAELLFFVELAKLAGDRFGDFGGNHFQSGGEGVSGPDRASQSVNRFGEKFFEFLKALVAPKRSVGVGQQEAHEQSHPCDLNALAQDIGRDGGDDTGESGEPKKVACAHGHATLRQHFLDVGDSCGSP